jgi:predicted enzyme related to lactoylglutathione lyase
MDFHCNCRTLRKIGSLKGEQMTVLRIFANIATEAPSEVQKFYTDLFGLGVLMDFGWIVTLGSEKRATTQVSLMSEGGSGTPVPDLSIEVDDVDAVHDRARAMDCEISYDLTDEPWGVRRFFVADPTGKVLNVLSHKR